MELPLLAGLLVLGLQRTVSINIFGSLECLTRLIQTFYNLSRWIAGVEDSQKTDVHYRYSEKSVTLLSLIDSYSLFRAFQSLRQNTRRFSSSSLLGLESTEHHYGSVHRLRLHDPRLPLTRQIPPLDLLPLRFSIIVIGAKHKQRRFRKDQRGLKT